MCENPSYDRDGNQIWCRKCKRCRNNRVSDWVGRCIAESRFAKQTHSVTLTYGPDKNGNKEHMHSSVLIYRDIQKYFKRLRKDGYKFKYLVVGEYGSKKRRSHWHMIIFWENNFPEIELGHNFYGHRQWPHGHTFWDEMTPASIWYVCKYLQKEQDDQEAESILRMSKKPPIGHEYFRDWARKHVDQGLSITSLHYSFTGVTHKDGKPKQFYLRGVSADNYIREYCQYFLKQKNSTHYPDSEIVDEWLDKQMRDTFEERYFIKEAENGKTFIEAFKKDYIHKKAKNQGGVSCYHKGVHPDVEPVAISKNGAFIDFYTDIETDPEKIFAQAITKGYTETSKSPEIPYKIQSPTGSIGKYKFAKTTNSNRANKNPKSRSKLPFK